MVERTVRDGVVRGVLAVQVALRIAAGNNAGQPLVRDQVQLFLELVIVRFVLRHLALPLAIAFAYRRSLLALVLLQLQVDDLLVIVDAVDRVVVIRRTARVAAGL